MRNLSSLWTTTSNLPPTHHDHCITGFTLDTDEDVSYVVSEDVRESDVQIELWRVGDDSLEHVASTTSPAIDGAVAQVVSLIVLPDTRDLCLITRAGDITTIALPPAAAVPSVVGTVAPGILSAALAPDASILVLVSAAPALILMATPDLTVLSEAPLHTTDPGVAQPVTAGWGAKATQFHGSLGKNAAQASAPARSTASPDDDTVPRIEWRGDAQFFAVSAREGARRVLRVYDRLGVLQSTAEDVPGLEHALAWRPSGALLASTQRFGAVPGADAKEWALGPGRDGRHDVVFFERNGLRHGEFTLRERAGPASASKAWGYRVRELAWNADSSVLAVWLERDTGDVVQLWTTGNYHWYLKLEIPAPGLIHLAWHAEDPARLILTSPQTVQDTRLTRYTAASPLGSGLVAVVDGDHILLTPFLTQNVPPPMSAQRLALPPSPPPTHIAFAPTSVSDGDIDTDTMVVLFPNATAALYAVPPLPRAPTLTWHGPVPACARQISSRTPTVFGVLCEERDADVLHTVALEGGAEVRGEVRWPGRRGRMVDGASGAWAWQAGDGAVYEAQCDSNEAPRLVARFPAFSSTATRVSSALYVALSGTTLVASTRAAPLSRACTSYAVAPPFLLYTTTAPAHEIAFVELSALGADTAADPGTPDKEPGPLVTQTRKIERGARIVVALPPAMRVVLQLPRGNLETIMPRPMVLARVRGHVLRGEYGVAFRAARTHRVDLDVLVTADPARFARSVGDVVKQVGDVEYLCLFLASLGRSTLPVAQVSDLCDSLRGELEQRGVRKYVRPILTAFVVKRPMDCEGALGVLGRLRAEDPALVEDAVKYIVFLVDAETLFDTALGMYDFDMVLLVAQHAQKDPREYLPFLRRLRAHQGAYQHFAIDDHLKRHAKALRSLRAAGPSYFEEARSYVVKHRLFGEAAVLWEGDEKGRAAMLEVYGDYLFEGREFGKAGLAFVQAKCARKAMVAYEKALDWQAQFDIAVGEGITGEELVATARRVADDLATKRRHAEAARVLLDYVDDVDEAVAALVRGGEWAEARRIITLRNRADLVPTLLMPGALDARASLGEEVAEIDELRTKQVTRLDELKAKKAEEPDAFYGVEDAGLANVDVMTDVSNPGTMFTRYTVAPSASSNRSRRTSRSKRKLDRKAGRKGTVEEEEYLLRSVTKLVTRLDAVLVEAGALLQQLLLLSGEHATEGQLLEEEVGALEDAVRRGVARIWDERTTSEENTPGANLVEKVPRPIVSEVAWRVGWIRGVGT